MDLLLNISIFAWYGAICPWYEFVHNSVIPIYRLIFLGLLVLLFRRLPFVLLTHKRIRYIENWRNAAFVGFFGPIGVSAIFYLYTSLEFLRTIQVDGNQRGDAARLSEVMVVVVWFMAICSIVSYLPRGFKSFKLDPFPNSKCTMQVVHGLSIPLGKLGFYLPRTMSRAISADDDEPAPFHLRQHLTSDERALESGIRRIRGRSRTKSSKSSDSEGLTSPRPLFRIGGTVIRDPRSQSRGDRGVNKADDTFDSSTQKQAKHVHELNIPRGKEGLAPPEKSPEPPRTPTERRTIKFPDDDDRGDNNTAEKT